MYLIIILSIIILSYLVDLVVEILNLKHVSNVLPGEFQGFYDADRYRKSQDYLKDNTKFDLIEQTFFVVMTIAFILIGGFNFVDRFARSFSFPDIVTGLIFAGILIIGHRLISLPFSVYHTFVLEQKYGFNRTTPWTFISDFLKSIFLLLLIGGSIFSLILWFFKTMGGVAWIYCWIAVVLFELFLTFIAPVVILPLFNKFIPLEDSELKSAIQAYADSQDFKLKGIYKIDASRRSTKSNAYFTGLGKYKRIALFDTLIQKHTVPQLVSVLAHEIGHYKKKHILKGIGVSIISTGIMFWVLNFFINNAGLSAAFKMQEVSVYSSIFFFGFLYTPMNLIISIIGNIISRKHEYAADRFAVKTYKNAQAFIDALKALTVDNLSNLKPHPLKVFLYYSHPPVLKRIEALRNIS